MPGSFSSILIHITFATKRREQFISERIAERLYLFMGGIIRDEGASLLEIGGMPDHVHLLVPLPTDRTVANLVRDVKTRSSGWVHRTLSLPDFGWQTGYSVFSVSESSKSRARRYIRNQKEHHKRQSFAEEYLELLRRHAIEFEERFALE